MRNEMEHDRADTYTSGKSKLARRVAVVASAATIGIIGLSAPAQAAELEPIAKEIDDLVAEVSSQVGDTLEALGI